MTDTANRKAHLGTDEVEFKFTFGAIRQASKLFRPTPLDKVIALVMAGDVDAIVGLAACGLAHMKLYDDRAIEMILENNPEQVPRLIAPMLIALHEGQRRMLTDEQRAKLEKQQAAFLGNAQGGKKETTPATGGQTSTPPSGSAEGSGSTPT